jgi:hypothetical protein
MDGLPKIYKLLQADNLVVGLQFFFTSYSTVITTYTTSEIKYFAIY